MKTENGQEFCPLCESTIVEEKTDDNGKVWLQCQFCGQFWEDGQ